MLKNFAIVFPGQGSQSIGMLSELATDHPIIEQTFQQASQVLQYNVWELIQKGPKERLDQTEFTQPAMLTADVALFRVWQELNLPSPRLMAGHSLGEYSALVCAEAVKFDEAVRLVSKRGQYMQQAVEHGKGAMAAIIGLDSQKVSDICEQAAQGEVVSPANFNSLEQVVIAGQAPAVKRALELASNAGAKLATLIPVSVPAHCQLMASAAEKLAKALSEISFHKPKIDVVHNVDVKIHHSADEIRQALIQQVTHSVHWVDTIDLFKNNQIENIVECGPGMVLTNLGKRITSKIKFFPAHNKTFLVKAISAFEDE